MRSDIRGPVLIGACAHAASGEWVTLTPQTAHLRRLKIAINTGIHCGSLLYTGSGTVWRA
jgi:hypothetical protein